ncbi:MAG: glyoxalase [Bacteroidetes bacterium]|nr:MAG: glyoxalase [Bacteroidota bacterium]
MATATSIIPCLTYQHAPKAIEWLCQAFGFEKRLVVPQDEHTIAHAQLSMGPGVMIMLSSAERTSEFGNYLRLPAQTSGQETQTPYIVLPDDAMKAHYQRAKAAGARILLELKTEEYGGQSYTCSDPEGHIWNFGSYDPWQDQ